MAKRGRKKKAGERYPSGKLMPATDRGTPEYQSRRAWAAGACNEDLMEKRKGKLDDSKVWHVLGILRTHDQITEEQYRAACEYRRTFCIVYRKPDVPAPALDGLPKGPTVDSDYVPDDPVEAEKWLKRAHDRMKRFADAIDGVVKVHGRAAKDTWDNLVVYDRTPRWMQPVIPRESDVKAASLFLRCLEVIEKAHTRKAAA